MTYIVYLVLLMSMTPAPQFMIVDDAKTMGGCFEAKKQMVKRLKLNAEQTTRLQCMPVITSELGEPL